MANEPTNTQLMETITEFRDEVMGAMNTFAEAMDRRFDRVETRLDRVEQDVAVLKTDVTSMRATMVTKSYLDDKFADEGARTGGQIRDTNLKIHALTDALVVEGSLRPATSTRITMMEPFPRRAPRRS